MRQFPVPGYTSTYLSGGDGGEEDGVGLPFFSCVCLLSPISLPFALKPMGLLPWWNGVRFSVALL